MKRALLVTACLAIALAIAAAAGLAWLLGTEDGLRLVMTRAASGSQGRLQIEEPRGALAGSVDIGRLAYEGDGFAVELRGVIGRVDLLGALGGRVALGPLRAKSLQITLSERKGEKRDAPVLGFGIRIADAEIDELSVLRNGERHALRSVRIEQASVDPGTPPALSAAATFELADARFPAKGRLEIAGTLEEARATLRLDEARASLEARAVVRPADDRPLRSLEARAGPIDLSRFDAALPRTAIEVSMSGAPAAADALRGTLTARNAQAGALDKGLAPITSLEARFAFQPTAADERDAKRMRASIASTRCCARAASTCARCAPTCGVPRCAGRSRSRLRPSRKPWTAISRRKG